ncbi:SRPBCC family protein [Gordonia sp. HNM0687]|uniref:SRPBCC family protein n=1 Tax=Gordonia mangrovi TaxID=2665643 RepID=A0A6L7GSX9_9ACTN|nr:SRPBCC family protein [Gordonia mangrovi]MXP23124.1 SRPBCC family protein [Gordonia mangrovi]UVF77407.1 SRPBCC family protein [Gordonia mangrovi]
MTTSAKHTHSIHVDAPVETVFDYVADPAHFVDAMSTMTADSDIVLGEVDRTPNGGVTGYEVKHRELGMHLTTTITREECVPNERLVDHASLGMEHMFTVAPDDTGTTLTYAWDSSRLMKMIDAVFYHTDRHVDEGLEKIRKEIEALA